MCVKSCGKSVCVRFECSVAESNEDTIRWEENKNVGYCDLLCDCVFLLDVSSNPPQHDGQLLRVFLPQLLKFNFWLTEE